MISLGIAQVRRPVEHRAATSYTGLVVQALESAAASGTGSTTAINTWAVEAAAGWYARLLALATVEPLNGRTRCLDPATLGYIGRSLARGGEVVFAIEIEGGMVELVPASYWNVWGRSTLRSGWQYQVQTEGPSATATRWLPAAAVAHVRYSWNPRQPWYGVSPAAGAGATARLVGGIEGSFANEAAAPAGYVMATPDVGDQGRTAESEDAADDALKVDMTNARGSTLLLPATAGGHGAGPMNAPQKEYVSTRYGFAPPEDLVALRTIVGRELFAAYGLSPSLSDPRPSGQTLREAWRQAVALVAEPLGRIVSSQMGPALGVPDLRLDFAAARAADVLSLTRAYQSLRRGEMTDADAREIVGL